MLGIFKKLGPGVRSMYNRRWVRRLTGSMIAILVLILIAVSVSHYVNAPSSGTITSAIPTASPQPAHTISLQGKYANFSYPSDFNPLPNDKPVPLLSIQVESLPTNNLRDNGSYNFRKTYPDHYTEVVKPINGQDIYILTDKTSSNYNKTAFFTHNGKVATVNINGGVPESSSDTDKMLTGIVSSWEWRP
jgi:hypothetical protein